jgi:hypothetical protein
VVDLAVRPKMPDLSGSVWIDGQNGESHLQRGAYVHLVKAKVNATDIRAAVADKVSGMNRLAEGTSENSGIGEDATALLGAVGAIKGEVTIDEALAVLNADRFKRYGVSRFDDFIGPATIATATADVNGHYEFAHVAPGSYFLAVNTKSGTVVRPVYMTKKPEKIDVH